MPLPPSSSEPQAATPCGLLLIDKPLGRTSMDVCRRVRGAFVAAGAPKRLKVGHGGTLDPLATGLLVILVGKATPLCDTIMQGHKDYVTTIDLSATSTTDDAEGQLAHIQNPTIPTLDQVRNSCEKFTGIIQQTPPIYSAMKVGGQRAYDLARQGKPVTLQPRPVHIHAINIISYTYPKLELSVTCGKGTYIRSLAKDLGASLRLGGYLTSLRRTRIGNFSITNAQTIDMLPRQLTQAHLIPIDQLHTDQTLTQP